MARQRLDADRIAAAYERDGRRLPGGRVPSPVLVVPGRPAPTPVPQAPRKPR
jgi:hypothetical protein